MTRSNALAYSGTRRKRASQQSSQGFRQWRSGCERGLGPSNAECGKVQLVFSPKIPVSVAEVYGVSFQISSVSINGYNHEA